MANLSYVQNQEDKSKMEKDQAYLQNLNLQDELRLAEELLKVKRERGILD